MKYAIGIDTGGTYTDAVLLNIEKRGADRVERKAKAVTTHHKLEIGIRKSIESLRLTETEILQIEKIVLSTTLATNAIIEGKTSNVGLISIGHRPKGEIAATLIKDIEGEINIKGRIIVDINEEEVRKAVNFMKHNVSAIGISGAASTRNPILEQKAKKIAEEICEIPVVCGHEIVNELGFLERTNTALLNAGLLHIIAGFINAIDNVIRSYGIVAPVFVVKGDGSVAKLESVRKIPIDTVLSGPAASMIGAINLTGLENAIVADMGGTTTDIGIVKQKRVELSHNGATVGKWKIRVKSAKLHTFGLGGDSHIRNENGFVKIGPRRVLPTCRGGIALTPTDILHYTGEFLKWNRDKTVNVVEQHASEIGVSPEDYISSVKDKLIKIIRLNTLKYNGLRLPVCAIGAPSKTWYSIARESCDFKLIIPDHYEVANAVGAATAAIQESVQVVIRPGESGYGYLVHTKDSRTTFINKKEAIDFAVSEAKRLAGKAIKDQNLVLSDLYVKGEIVYSHKNKLVCDQLQINSTESFEFTDRDESYSYVECKIQAIASGKIFDSDSL